MTLNAGNIRTAESGKRFELDSISLKGYRSNETVWYELTNNAATPFFAFYGEDSTPSLYADADGDLIMKGTLEASDIHIPDANTITSFNVSGATGAVWVGDTSYTGAPFKISPGGDVTLNNAIVTGNINLDDVGQILIGAPTGYDPSAGEGLVLGELASITFGQDTDKWLGMFTPSAPAFGAVWSRRGGMGWREYNAGASMEESVEVRVASGYPREPTQSGAPPTPTDEPVEAIISLKSMGNTQGVDNTTGLAYIDYSASAHRFEGLMQVNGAVRVWDGSAVSPSYGFKDDGATNTGMYRIAENTIGWSNAGSERMRLSMTRLQMSVDIDLKTNQVLTNGTAGRPDLALEADPDTGIYISPLGARVAQGSADYYKFEQAFGTAVMTIATIQNWGSTASSQPLRYATSNIAGGPSVNTVFRYTSRRDLKDEIEPHNLLASIPTGELPYVGHKFHMRADESKTLQNPTLRNDR
jgi:hypothetical protein